MSDQQHRNSWHLLLIEDSEEDFVVFARTVRRTTVPVMLQRVASGDAALDYLYRRGMFADDQPEAHPALILLDLNLPGIDGRDVLKIIKRDEQLCHIPVVILTTSNNPKDIDDCYQRGANSYMVKPVDYPTFMQNMQCLLSYWFETVTLSALGK